LSKLLIVDDSAVQREVIASTFKSFGFTEIYFAKDVKEALILFIQINPDIITMDIIMPGINGVAGIEQIMRIKKEAIIFVITSLADPVTSLDAMKKGARSIFLKPFNPEKLQKAVAHWLSVVKT
jgi:two-component system chemotaxis response regulator CheY